MSTPADDPQREARLDQLWAEFLQRRDAGEPIEIQGFLAANPAFASELKELLDTADLVDAMAGPAEGEAPQHNPSPRTRGDQASRHVGETLALDPNATPRANQTRAATPERLHAGTDFDIALESGQFCIFGDYELLKTLGRGGMGVVFKARQISLNRIVALKMILAGKLASPADIRRFRAEAQAAGKLGHPHIVNVFEADEVDGRHYFTMEYVEGHTLAQIINGQPLPPQRAARYLELIARAVDCAHEQDILHRDLKPANVIVDERDEPQVTDFGLAKDMTDEANFTTSGAAIGTPGYMAPEQAAGRRGEISPAVDVYSLGAILYEMLTGRPPFSGDSVVDIILDVIHKDPLPPRVLNPAVDRELESVCLKCLRKGPAERYASALEVAEEMRRYLEGRPVLAQPLSLTQRAAHWVRDVPMVSAILGRRVYAPSPWQVRSQWLALAFAMAALAALAVWFSSEKPLPPQIRIASGGAGGMYYRASTALAEPLESVTERPVTVLETAGSYANRALLEQGAAEIALVQSEALTSRSLAVVTPLYYEMVLVVARDGRGIRHMADLEGRRVALGRHGSGMRSTALTILAHYGIDGETINGSQAPFSELLTDPDLDAAFVISGFDNEMLKRVLANPTIVLVPITEALEIADTEPSLKATRLTPTNAPSYLRNKIPEGGMATLRTPAFLTVRADASPQLVRAALRAIYRDSDFVSREQLIPLEQAARWPLLPLHPAAEDFFQAVREAEDPRHATKGTPRK
jgi:TRAP transporter TAXI family solute receptor